jgi:Predicted Fe-S oxidoreductases
MSQGSKLWKQAKAGLRLAKAHAFKSKVPMLVSYAVTKQCNLSCKYCTQNLYDFPGEELNTAQSKKMIGEMAQAGTYLLMLSGGEPLVREDIVELAAHAAGCGLTVAMSSNGSLLPQRQEILRHLDYVTISLDGLRDVHDSARGKGTFDLALAGIQAAKAAGAQVITTTTLGLHNIDRLDEFFRLIVELGVVPRFQVETSLGAMEEKLWDPKVIGERKRQRPGHARIIEGLVQVKAFGERQGLNLLSAQALEYVMNWPDYSQVTLKKKDPNLADIPCYAGRFHMYVTWTGLLYPCCGMLLATPGVSAVEHGFQEAYRRMRHPACAGCLLIPVIELNRMLSLRPSALAQAVKLGLKRRPGKTAGAAKIQGAG